MEKSNCSFRCGADDYKSILIHYDSSLPQIHLENKALYVTSERKLRKATKENKGYIHLLGTVKQENITCDSTFTNQAKSSKASAQDF